MSKNRPELASWPIFPVEKAQYSEVRKSSTFTALWHCYSQIAQRSGDHARGVISFSPAFLIQVRQDVLWLSFYDNPFSSRILWYSIPLSFSLFLLTLETSLHQRGGLKEVENKWAWGEGASAGRG